MNVDKLKIKRPRYIANNERHVVQSFRPKLFQIHKHGIELLGLKEFLKEEKG